MSTDYGRNFSHLGRTNASPTDRHSPIYKAISVSSSGKFVALLDYESETVSILVSDDYGNNFRSIEVINQLEGAACEYEQYTFRKENFYATAITISDNGVVYLGGWLWISGVDLEDLNGFPVDSSEAVFFRITDLDTVEGPFAQCITPFEIDAQHEVKYFNKISGGTNGTNIIFDMICSDDGSKFATLATSECCMASFWRGNPDETLTCKEGVPPNIPPGSFPGGFSAEYAQNRWSALIVYDHNTGSFEKIDELNFSSDYQIPHGFHRDPYAPVADWQSSRWGQFAGLHKASSDLEKFVLTIDDPYGIYFIYTDDFARSKEFNYFKSCGLPARFNYESPVPSPGVITSPQNKTNNCPEYMIPFTNIKSSAGYIGKETNSLSAAALKLERGVMEFYEWVGSKLGAQAYVFDSESNARIDLPNASSAGNTGYERRGILITPNCERIYIWYANDVYAIECAGPPTPPPPPDKNDVCFVSAAIETMPPMFNNILNTDIIGTIHNNLFQNLWDSAYEFALHSGRELVDTASNNSSGNPITRTIHMNNMQIQTSDEGRYITCANGYSTDYGSTFTHFPLNTDGTFPGQKAPIFISAVSPNGKYIVGFGSEYAGKAINSDGGRKAFMWLSENSGETFELKPLPTWIKSKTLAGSNIVDLFPTKYTIKNLVVSNFGDIYFTHLDRQHQYRYRYNNSGISTRDEDNYIWNIYRWSLTDIEPVFIARYDVKSYYMDALYDPTGTIFLDDVWYPRINIEASHMVCSDDGNRVILTTSEMGLAFVGNAKTASPTVHKIGILYTNDIPQLRQGYIAVGSVQAGNIQVGGCTTNRQATRLTKVIKLDPELNRFALALDARSDEENVVTLNPIGYDKQNFPHPIVLLKSWDDSDFHTGYATFEGFDPTMASFLQQYGFDNSEDYTRYKNWSVDGLAIVATHEHEYQFTMPYTESFGEDILIVSYGKDRKRVFYNDQPDAPNSRTPKLIGPDASSDGGNNFERSLVISSDGSRIYTWKDYSDSTESVPPEDGFKVRLYDLHCGGSSLPSNQFFVLEDDLQVFDSVDTLLSAEDVVVPDVIKQPDWDDVTSAAGEVPANVIGTEQVFGIPKLNKIVVLYTTKDNDGTESLNRTIISAPLLNSNPDISVQFGTKVAMKKFVNYQGKVKFEVAVSAPYYKNGNGISVGYIALYSNDYSENDNEWHLVGSKCGLSVEQCLFIPEDSNNVYWPGVDFSLDPTKYGLPAAVDNKPVFYPPLIGRDFLFYDSNSSIIAGVNGQRNSSFVPVYATLNNGTPIEPGDDPIVANYNKLFIWGSIYKLNHRINDGVVCGMIPEGISSGSGGICMVGDVGRNKLVVVNTVDPPGTTTSKTYYFVSADVNNPISGNTNTGRITSVSNLYFDLSYSPITHYLYGDNIYEPIVGGQVQSVDYGGSYEKLGTSVACAHYPNIRLAGEFVINASVFFGKDVNHPILDSKTRIAKRYIDHEYDNIDTGLNTILPTAQQSEGNDDGFGKIIAHVASTYNWDGSEGGLTGAHYDNFAIFGNNYIKLSGNSSSLRNNSDFCDSSKVEGSLIGLAQVLNDFPTGKVIDARFYFGKLIIYYVNENAYDYKMAIYNLPFNKMLFDFDYTCYPAFTPSDPRIPIIRF